MRSHQRQHSFGGIGVLIACAAAGLTLSGALLPATPGHAADAKNANQRPATTKAAPKATTKAMTKPGAAKTTKRNTTRPTTRAKSSTTVPKTSPAGSPESVRSGVVGSVPGVRVTAECAPQNGGLSTYAKVFHDVHLFSEERVAKNPLYATVSKLTARTPEATKVLYSFREPIVALFQESSGDMLFSKEYANSFEVSLPPAPERVAIEIVTSAVDFAKLDNPVTKSPFETPREVYDAMYANVGLGTPLTKDRESLYDALLRTRTTSTTVNFTIDVQPCSFGSTAGNLRIAAS